MASYQYVYHMDGVSKTYPGGKKCFENIRLSFLPGVKIGVVGVNGAGKSTLLRIMAGIDKDFSGEAWAAKGARVGYRGRYRAQQDTMLGIIAAGYGDGYTRHFRTGTPVLINGRRVPLIGNVSMDMIAVDVTRVPGVRVGDEVTVDDIRMAVLAMDGQRQTPNLT